MSLKQRKNKRAHLFDYLEILDQETGSVIGHLADLSPQGIMLISREPFDVKAEISFSLKLPESFSEHKMINFKGRVLWCKKDVNPEYYMSGFKFCEIGDNEINTLNNLINSYGFIHR